jgi:alkanesulfonate monooxygenase SsuD/methylene tetrahydromethanopterin reductase-like flavin-dependent oxidoreductase (luciferase family)
MTRLGYQIPNFTYPDTRPEEIFDKVVAQAKAAEAAGYDRVLLMDHFYQLPGIGTRRCSRKPSPLSIMSRAAALPLASARAGSRPSMWGSASSSAR